MLIIVDDEIVHDPVIIRLSKDLNSHPQKVIGQLFTLSWYLNRYSDFIGLPSSITPEFISKVFEFPDSDKLMEVLENNDCFWSKDDYYEIGYLLSHYFIQSESRHVKNI